MKAIVLIVSLLVPVVTQAQVYSPRAKEVKMSFTASFESSAPEDSGVLAENHFSHIFGMLKAQSVVKGFDVDFEKIEGLGAPQMPPDMTILEEKDLGEGRYKITYRASTRVLLLNHVANALLKKGVWSQPLPYDLDKYYSRKCTDDHYFEIGDFWYFYDMYREGCEKLTEEPLARMVDITIKPSGITRELDMDARLDLVRGPNANGDLFQIDIIHGFSDGSTQPEDEGRENFAITNEYFVDLGFKERVDNAAFNRTLYSYTKDMEVPYVARNGETKMRKINVLVRHLLVEAGADSRGITFAKFFKDAVENADVLIYSGHSGLGGNLDIDTLEYKAGLKYVDGKLVHNPKDGTFRFNSKKRQIFFFDSCSSYSYYLWPFREEKTRARLDLITYALSSYFTTGPDVLKALVNVLLDETNVTQTWDKILKAMEAPLDNGSYILSVGGI